MPNQLNGFALHTATHMISESAWINLVLVKLYANPGVSAMQCFAHYDGIIDV
jgi:hypothetical protein